MGSTHKAWFLGIDIGTGSCKAVVADENLEILGFGTSDYGGEDPRVKWLEQNVYEILSATIESSLKAIDKAKVEKNKCVALSIGGALHTFLPVGDDGDPLTPAITWADVRAAGYAERLRLSGLGLELYKRTGCPPHPMYPFYKLLWLKEERPEVFKKTRRILSVKEFVFHRITGKYAVDYSLASGSGFLNAKTLRWDELALEVAGVKPDIFSPLCEPTSSFSFVNEEIAQKIGVPQKTIVVMGSSDAVNSSLGAGAVSPNQATCMVGTSGAMRVMERKPIIDEKMRTWCYAIESGRWLIGGAINNGGIILDWLKDVLEISSTSDILSMAEKSEIGGKGVICLPFFAGERSPNWNFNARASILGLTLEHKKEHIARAFLESIAFRLRSVQNALSELVPDIGEVRVSGGLTQSSFWLRMLAGVLKKEILVPAWKETSALGASIWAMIGAGVFNGLGDASKLVKVEEKFEPDPQEVQTYDRTFRLYEKLYNLLSPIFSEFSALY